MKSAMIRSRLGEVAALLATPLTPSHYLALASPLLASHRLVGRVVSVADEAPGVRTLVLRPGRTWRRHRAGQHVRVTVAVGGRLATRTFSIASPPEREDGCIAITVKAVAGGRVTPVLVRQVLPGAYLTLAQPEGSFVMPDDRPVRPLFITAGSGITPVASMLRSLAARGAMPDAVHLHYARTPGEVIFGDELRAMARAYPGYRPVFVHTRVDRRRFSAARLDEIAADWREREAWACGPPDLLETLAASFASAGLSHALHIERFAAVLAAPPADARGGRVRFATSSCAALAEAGTPLLEVAERAGVAAPHGCRMGICHSCDTTLISGCARDLRTGERIDQPGARVQICVSAAAGDLELAL
jgi:ferredoxin-NADP reductase